MMRTVIRFNIDHFRKLLATEIDDGQRQTIMRLLAEEEKKLAALEDPLGGGDASLSHANRQR